MTVATKQATKADVGLPNVDNTSDANKPVSTAQAAAIGAKADATATAAALASKVPSSAVGQANGVASLGSDGKVPAGQLPAGQANTVTAAGISDSTAPGRTLLTAVDVAAQKSALSLQNVDNTADANKPVSTAQQSALNLKADALHTHAAAEISDATAAGRALLTAANVAAQKTALALQNVDNTSDANKPVSTAQATAIAAKLDASARGAANGVASLGSDSKILAAQLPSIAITDVFVAADQAAMLALVAEKGDIAVRSDLNKTFALSTNNPGTLADWIELKTPTDAVLSVAGRTGAVVLTSTDITDTTAAGRTLMKAADAAAQKTALSLGKTDVGLGNVDNTSDANKPVSTAQATAIGAKANQSSVDTLATALGGFSIRSITQSAYDALGSKDPNTLYVIVGA